MKKQDKNDYENNLEQWNDLFSILDRKFFNMVEWILKDKLGY